MDSYLEYLVEKFLIFDKRAELDESNSINDIDKIKCCINTMFKKLTDDVYIKVTCDILEMFSCYDILDFSFSDKKEKSCANDVYMLYKNYKMSSASKTKTTNEKETSILKMDTNVDTSNVKYICSVDYCIDMTDDPLEIKSDTKKWNLEYKFKIKYGKSYYIFSVYNWKDNNRWHITSNRWHITSNRWHIASDTSNKKVIDLFLKELEKYGSEKCC